VGPVEIGLGAVEDDDVEVEVLLDEVNELGEFGHGPRGDRVDRGVVRKSPATTAA